MSKETANKSVMLVEDEDSIAIALRFLLEREGYEVSRVADGKSAIEEIKRRAPDLVLLDVMLPGASGYEVCQSIRLNSALDDVKIMMITARASATERRKGLALGADSFLGKPFSNTEVKAEARRLLSEKALGDD
ncbi:MAG: response regulator [Pseudomonadota bacterium]